MDPVRTVNYTAYDGMNRVTGKSYTDGTTPTVNYFYCDTIAGSCAANCSQKGRLSAVSTVTGSTTITSNNYSCFDQVGRVTASNQQIAGTTYSFSYTYDLSGALASITYPSLRKVTDTFDTSGRISSVQGALSGVTTPYASAITYAPQGAIQSLNLNNGLAENWNFNTRQQPTGLTLGNTTTTLMSLGWTYGALSSDNGNIATHTIQRSIGLASPSTVLTQNFSYADPANRLSSASEVSGWSQGYVYDAFGNRQVTASSYLPNGGYTPIQGSPATQYTNNRWIRGTGDLYDGAGNQLSLAMATSPYNTPASTFTYDGENRLLTANVAQGGGVASFVYDGEGRRVQKTAGSGSNAVTTTYVHDAMGQLAAEYSTQAPTVTGTQYPTTDFLGSTRLITNGSGTPQRWYRLPALR